MKKLIKLLMPMVISLSASGASIDYLMNNSSVYLGNPAQTANISVESAFFNPAGLVYLDDGLYLNINAFLSSVEESTVLDGQKYKADDFPVTPSFNLVYKKEKFSYYFNTSIIAGGATLNFKDGVPGLELAAQGINKLDPLKNTSRALNANLENGNFDGENRYFQGAVGISYLLNDKVSVSLGGKYVYGIRKLSGHAEYSYNKSSPLGAIVDGNALHIDSKRTADGFGGILGIDIKPTDTLNIALKFETPVKLNFKASTSEDEKIYLGFLNRSLGISTFYPEYKDGNKMRRDLPAVLSAGVSNKINKVTLLFSYSHYFNKAANIDNQNYDDGNEAGIGIMYDINDKFTWTAGINIADTGASRATYDDTEFALNSQLYGTGVIFKPNEKNEFVLSLAYIHYNSENGVDEHFVPGADFEKSKVRYKKSITSLGLGYTYKF
ncbi:Outer membrane protein transport protein (OMPP1/FadL/TodX) [Sebaldella termitidis]|uniref:Membrane protein involved in aromatic hydrocarbon degradation n=1 Tax=Sebaldella termitidis (strain ATCC 33386 / NCTC 11300) TaxID=526218 RepID=D1AQS9_SEBTE|nr:outer membrane protein transport protein [Sebaldella termitidis]ACZ10339.1 membrane protein involved in aromatic hydrocarbon degradation [Sebaldella termitidis ATCC 33386]SUI25680.1 Outer membrane protein transport protein (OMPP1/FadL/TodX) [Sebaldella termitidis]